MGTLVFVGLGLWDERDISLRGLDEARGADAVYAEAYTSRLVGTTPGAIERLVGKPITTLSREQVEDGRIILEACRTGTVALLVPGDPMAATTHVDLRTRAQGQGTGVRLVHGTSILTAAPGLLGLQVYKFGRTTTLPFTSPSFRPTSPLEVVESNLRSGLHSLILLDLKDEEHLEAREGLRYLLTVARETGGKFVGPTTTACVLSRVGSPEPRVTVGRMADLAARDLGPPLQCIVVPGKLHFQEEEALARFRP